MVHCLWIFGCTLGAEYSTLAVCLPEDLQALHLHAEGALACGTHSISDYLCKGVCTFAVQGKNITFVIVQITT
eukprot:1539751-Amphidinium_carterae.1